MWNQWIQHKGSGSRNPVDCIQPNSEQVRCRVEALGSNPVQCTNAMSDTVQRCCLCKPKPVLKPKKVVPSCTIDIDSESCATWGSEDTQCKDVVHVGLTTKTWKRTPAYRYHGGRRVKGQDTIGAAFQQQWRSARAGP